MFIRKGTSDDAEDCLEIFRLDNERYWETTDFRKSARHEDVIFLVAEETKRIVGYILGFTVPTKRVEATIHETRAHKKERRKGIGTKLVNAFCEEAFKRGAKVVLAEIASEHLRFYCESCEFKEINRWIEVARKKNG